MKIVASIPKTYTEEAFFGMFKKPKADKPWSTKRKEAKTSFLAYVKTLFDNKVIKHIKNLGMEFSVSDKAGTVVLKPLHRVNKNDIQAATWSYTGELFFSLGGKVKTVAANTLDQLFTSLEGMSKGDLNASILLKQEVKAGLEDPDFGAMENEIAEQPLLKSWKSVSVYDVTIGNDGLVITFNTPKPHDPRDVFDWDDAKKDALEKVLKKLGYDVSYNGMAAARNYKLSIYFDYA